MLDFKRLKLLIFDLDGTLIDSKLDIANAMNRTLEKYSLPPLDPDNVWAFLGDGAKYLVDRCFGYYDRETPQDATCFFLSDYMKNSQINTAPYPGISKLLLNLKSFKKAVLSNKLHEITSELCKNLFPTRPFDLVLGRSDKLKKKPAPDGILRILNKLDISSSDSAIIGDTTIDLEAGRKAGIKRIAVTWGVHDKRKLRGEDPDAIVENIDELEKLLEI